MIPGYFICKSVKDVIFTLIAMYLNNIINKVLESLKNVGHVCFRNRGNGKQERRGQIS